MHLKSQGLLSQELQEFIQGVGFAFELDVTFPGSFKLPFVGNEASIRRKTLNPFMEKAWVVYHGSLLSAYAMKSLRFDRATVSQDGLEESCRSPTRPRPRRAEPRPCPRIRSTSSTMPSWESPAT